MSKKNIILVLLLTCFMSLMALSVWGKKAEVADKIYATDIKIYDQDLKEVSEKDLEDTTYNPLIIDNDKDSDIEVYKYYFYINLIPDNVTNYNLVSNIKKGSSYSKLEELNYANWHTLSTNSVDVKNTMHFYEITFTRQDIVVIEFSYNLDLAKPSTIYLKFIWDGDNHGGFIPS